MGPYVKNVSISSGNESKSEIRRQFYFQYMDNPCSNVIYINDSPLVVQNKNICEYPIFLWHKMSEQKLWEHKDFWFMPNAGDISHPLQAIDICNHFLVCIYDITADIRSQRCWLIYSAHGTRYLIDWYIAHHVFMLCWPTAYYHSYYRHASYLLTCWRSID